MIQEFSVITILMKIYVKIDKGKAAPYRKLWMFNVIKDLRN